MKSDLAQCWGGWHEGGVRSDGFTHTADPLTPFPLSPLPGKLVLEPEEANRMGPGKQGQQEALWD